METRNATSAKMNNFEITDNSFNQNGAVKALSAEEANGCFQFFVGGGAAKDDPKAVENGTNDQNNKGNREIGKHRIEDTKIFHMPQERQEVSRRRIQ